MPHFINFKMISPDIIKSYNKKFDNKIFANYFIMALLYDASCDTNEYRKYLKDFNYRIFFDKEFTFIDKNILIFNIS